MAGWRVRALLSLMNFTSARFKAETAGPGPGAYNPESNNDGWDNSEGGASLKATSDRFNAARGDLPVS